MRTLPWLALLLLAGCTVGPDYVRPAQSTPAEWVTPTAAPLVAAPRVETADELARWWTWFEDPLLDSLVERALAQGFDVRTAEARLAAARAERRAAQAGFGPQVGLGVGSSRLQNPMPGLAPGLTFSLHEVGFDARWELDLFGRQRRRVEAASAVVDASEVDVRAARTVLCAEVARAYFELRGAEREARLLDAALALNAEDARRAHALAEAGLLASDEALAAEARGAELSAARIAPNRARDAARRQLERLLGVLPGELDATLVASDAPAPQLAPRLLLTPAAVLRQRPDVQRAERQLAAATALEGAALADMYPRVSLAMFFGLRNTALSTLMSIASKSWSGGASVLQPLFDAGRLRALVDVRRAEAEAALIEYERVSLDALHDTEGALFRWLTAERERDARRAALARRETAAAHARRRREQGVGGAREALAAELAVVTARLDAERSAAEVTAATVAVMKALGAGIPIDAPAGLARRD